jgi:BlaI family transcriptional regulator, penicillinase repressor
MSPRMSSPGPSAGRPPREIPPPLELECLKALWGIGEGTVRDVREILVGNRNLAYTTVMTVLDRLEKRGGVSRRKQGRSFVYEPKVSQDAVRRYAVKELVDTFFGGSEEALRSYLQSSPTAGKSDLESPGSMDTELL